jgi:pimeloyl-ACP methyl ester carboxylesterase
VTAFGEHHRGGSGPPLFLIHGFTGTWRAWGPVVGLLEEQFEVLAPTVGGHTGGPDLDLDEVSIDRITDGLEAMLDEVGWQRPHVAGWSMGGQLSLELAKRGRARSVTALAPGGAHGDHMDRVLRKTERLFKRDHGAARRFARLNARMVGSPGFRRLAMRNQMIYGDRMDPEASAAITEAFAQTPIFAPYIDHIRAGERKLEGLEAIDVPVTVAWGDTDRVLPQGKHEAFFREHLPQARFLTLKKAGHTPFWDAPERVADVIAQTALRTERTAA